MKSYEVLKRALDSPHISPKEIASELGISLSLIYKWAQPNSDNGSGSRNPLDRVAALIELTRHQEIIEWLAHEAGGYFVRNPDGCPTTDYEMVPATHAIIQQFAHLLDAVSRAAADNHISPEESKEIRQGWDRLKSYCEGFVRCCEGGDFAKIRKDLSAS